MSRAAPRLCEDRDARQVAIANIAGVLSLVAQMPVSRESSVSSVPPRLLHVSPARPLTLSLGALGFGLLVDIIGRRWAFNLTCLITSVFGMLIAAPSYNYSAVCGIYLLSSIGLGGNIPIDAIIAHEFLPQSRRNLVSLLSMWQPIGVVVASAVDYGTVAKYRCDTTLPSCATVSGSTACCTVQSNMGWRYAVIVLGAMTLFVFFLRYFVFHFHESPKFLLSKGKEQEAIDVLHKIAKFNRAPPPMLTLEMFHQVDAEFAGGEFQAPVQAKHVVRNAWDSITKLRGLFGRKLQAFTFFLLAITYMVSYASR